MRKLEELLASLLSPEQIAALKEEIAAAMRRINSKVEDNERMKARKEEMIALMQRIDQIIEGHSSTPFFLRTIYAAAKTNVKKMLAPMIEEMFRTEEGSKLDDIPPREHPQKAAPKPAEEVVVVKKQEKVQQQKNTPKEEPAAPREEALSQPEGEKRPGDRDKRRRRRGGRTHHHPRRDSGGGEKLITTMSDAEPNEAPQRPKGSRNSNRGPYEE